MNAPVDHPDSTEHLRRWLLAVGCGALLIFFFSPSFAAFSFWARVPELSGMIEVRRGASVLQQMQNLGAPIADPLHGAIQWRLLFPIIGRVLHLPSWAMFGLAHVGCLFALGFVVTILRRNGLSFARTALATLLIGAGAWFFAATGWLGYYDSWLVLALLIVAFAEVRWSVWAACLWAPWIDERFAIAVPLALVCRFVDAARKGRAFDWKREAGVPFALVAMFVAVRLGVLAGRSDGNAQPRAYLGALDALGAPITRILFGAWAGLRVGWCLVVLAVGVLFARNRTHGVALGAATLVTIAIGLATAQDFGRSMMFVAPVAVLGAVLAADIPLPRIAVATALTLLLPAHHVMSNHVAPIFYLYQSLSLYDTPPRAVMPEVIELEAIRAMQNGDFATAEKGLSLAITLSPNPTDAAKQRGVLRASRGRWKEAAEDFVLMTKHEPKNPDAWFMCAQAALATGDSAGARTNMERALGFAPTGWTSRPDVARFQARLQQAR